MVEKNYVVSNNGKQYFKGDSVKTDCSNGSYKRIIQSGIVGTIYKGNTFSLLCNSSGALESVSYLLGGEKIVD